MPELAKWVNSDLKRGFTVSQVAEKHACPACPVAPVDGTGVGPEDPTGGWTEPMVRVIGEAKRAVFLVRGFNFLNRYFRYSSRSHICHMQD